MFWYSNRVDEAVPCLPLWASMGFFALLHRLSDFCCRTRQTPLACLPKTASMAPNYFAHIGTDHPVEVHAATSLVRSVFAFPESLQFGFFVAIRV